VALEAHHNGDARKNMVADGRRQSRRRGDRERTQNKLEGESLGRILLAILSIEKRMLENLEYKNLINNFAFQKVGKII
jgi:hypothetical protein